MRRYLTAALVAVCTIGVGSPAWSAGAGEAAYTFLKIGTDARTEGMGGAQVGLADALGGVAYNPAALARTAPRRFMATYTSWLAGIQSGFIASAWQMGAAGRLGVSVQYLNYGDFKARDALGNIASDFGASDFALALSAAGSLGGHGDWGASGRFISESIAGESSTGLAVDAGVSFDLPDGRTRVGASVRNAGFQMKAIGEGKKSKLPVTGVVGMSHRLHGVPLLVAADLLKPSDDTFGAAGGLEVTVAEPLAVRLGYNTLAGKIDTDSSRDKWAGMTFGFGVTAGRLALDYAYGSYSKLGSTHRFTLRTGL